MQGIDISSNNGSIDFSKVKAAGIEIVYIKATEGTTYTNEYLSEHYKGAKAVGLTVGFYHYLLKNNIPNQAGYFLNAISSYPADCKYVVDIENSEETWSISEASTAVKQFANYLTGLGKEVTIYTGDYFYRDNLNSSVKDIPLWVSNYGGAILATNYVGLQYSESGRISGINGNVDTDNFSAGILLTQLSSALVSATTSATLKSQIMALQYYLNLDYNAKLVHVDGNIYQELLDNLEGVGKLIIKDHKSHVVQWIQQKLIKYGYLKDGQATMVYDEPTFQAITNLQKNWGRETSGKILVSNNTWPIFLNN